MTMPIVRYALSAVWHLSYSGLVSLYFVLSYSCFHSFTLSVGLRLFLKPPADWLSLSRSSLKQQLLGSPQVVSEHLHHHRHHCHSHYHQQTSLAEGSNRSVGTAASYLYSSFEPEPPCEQSNVRGMSSKHFILHYSVGARLLTY